MEAGGVGERMKATRLEGQPQVMGFYFVSKSLYFCHDFSRIDSCSFERLHPGGCTLFLIIRMSFTPSTT